MTDPAATAARAAATALAPAHPNLPADIEAALASRHATGRANQFLDPISLATLIVTIAQLTWTIYTDRRDHAAEPPPPQTLARQVRIALREQDIALPDGTEHITEIIATEITRHATPHE